MINEEKTPTTRLPDGLMREHLPPIEQLSPEFAAIVDDARSSAAKIGALVSGVGGSGRGRAIEAAARAIYNGWWEDGEPDVSAEWENLEADDKDRESAVWMAEAGLAAAVPVLLNDLADSIEARRSPNIEGSAIGLGHNMAIDEIASLVRAAAAGWGEA